MGLLGIVGVLMGLGCFAFVVLGALNTAFDWRLVISVSGAPVEVPRSWDVVAGLAACGALFIGLSFFGSYVIRKFKAAKGRPLVRVGILAGALGLLAVAFRGLQILALTATYGSMLAYYCTDGDLEDVEAELAKGPSPEVLRESISRARQYGNTEALKRLVAAGARYAPPAEGERADFCGFDSPKVDAEFVRVALAGGAQPKTCAEGDALIFDLARQGGDDAVVAAKIEALIGAGWSPEAVPEGTPVPAKGGKVSALGWAQKHKLPATIAVLKAARAAAAPASAAGTVPASVPASAPASVPASVPMSAPASAPVSAPASVL